MGGAFSMRAGGRRLGVARGCGPFFIVLGDAPASFVGVSIFVRVAVGNLSRFMRLYSESAALWLRFRWLSNEKSGIPQALFRFLSLSFFGSPCCLSAHLHLLVYLQVQYELIIVCMFERTDFSWLNIVRLF